MKRLSTIFTLIVLSLVIIPVAQAKYPEKPITIIVPASAGGSSDVDARGMAPYLQQYLGVPVVVENVVGARGVVGYNRFYRTDPDGHTILFFNLPSPLVYELTQKVEYRTLDYTFIRANTTKSFVLITPYGKYKGFNEFVEKAKTTKLKLALTGPSSDLQGYLAQDSLGLKFNWIPFEGAAKGLAAVVGGHIDGAVIFLLRAIPLVQAKKVDVPLAFIDQRDSRIPNTLTAKELGYDITSVPVVSGIVGPPGMSADKVKVIEDAMVRLAKEPKYLEWAEKNGVVIESVPSGDFKKVTEKQYELVKKYKDLFK